MKYVYEHGARTFRGYFFWNGNPVDVTDRATLQAIQNEDGFKAVEEEVKAAPVVRQVLHVPAKRGGWPLGRPRK